MDTYSGLKCDKWVANVNATTRADAVVQLSALGYECDRVVIATIFARYNCYRDHRLIASVDAWSQAEARARCGGEADEISLNRVLKAPASVPDDPEDRRLERWGM